MTPETQLPGFVPASEILPRNQSREEELEELIRKLSAEAELRNDVNAAELTNRQAAKKSLTGPKPQEWQALQTVINDLLEAKKELQDDIEQIRECFPRMLAEDRRRITALEQGPVQIVKESKTAQAHVNELYDHMKAIGRKQFTFKDAARCLKISKSRILQFKAIIALDERFIIISSETHKQRRLIRLREFYNEYQTVRPPNLAVGGPPG